MTTIWEAVGRFFGPSHNQRCMELLQQLAKIGVEGAHYLTATKGQDLAGIIDIEHRADAVCDEIHELLDDSFIMRFDIADMMALSDELDNVVDGFRKVATHISIYKTQLAQLRPEAQELMTISERMATDLSNLAGALSQKRTSLPDVRAIVEKLEAAESEADTIVADAERKLVAEYTPPGANRLEFIAWDKLYQLLEQTTDHANHCGKLMLSLARKEA